MTDTLESFQIISLNVNGLNDVRKRRLTFNYLQKFKKTVFLLQETHCQPGNGKLWKSQWGSTLFLTEESSNTGGVATLFTKDLDPVLSNITPSRSNRLLITEFSLMGEDFKVVNAYMPTSNNENLQMEILEELNLLINYDEGAHLFLGGDFNVSLHPEIDQLGYTNRDIPNKRYRDEIERFLEKLDLGDLWRIQHPKTFNHTWSRLGHFARLDYIFTPLNFPGLVQAYAPETIPFSDHRLVAVKIRPCPHPKGKGFWKFKTSLLHCEEFCKALGSTIEEAVIQAKDLSPQMRWEFIKFSIRECAIKTEKKRKLDQNKLEAELETQLIDLDKDLYRSSEIQEEYQVVKRELYQIQLARTRESMIRSKVKWVGEGERPTKYFLNLERKNYDSKVISSLFDAEGKVQTDPGEILKVEKAYFTKQYALNPLNVGALERGEGTEFLQPVRGISDLDRQLLNREISIEELEWALKDMQNGKAPGSDGLPPEVYKKFWGLLGLHLLASLNQAEQVGVLSSEQRRGIITLIPKKGKDKRYLQNWRPISMLNCDYKIIAKALAKRLALVLPNIIHPNQTGFVPTRFIGDNIRNIQSLIDFTQETGRSGLIVSLDFRAAFDSVSHPFLEKALESYNLGDNFMSWISTLYAQAESCVINCGLS